MTKEMIMSMMGVSSEEKSMKYCEMSQAGGAVRTKLKRTNSNMKGKLERVRIMNGPRRK